MKYNKLWQLIAENSDEPVYKVFENCGISRQTMYVMRNPEKPMYGRAAGSVNLAVIGKLCSYLHCQPCDIMELGD